MKTFNQYHNDYILNVEEPIQIEHIGNFLAKVDTGNEAYNVMHADKISDAGDNKVQFTTNDKTFIVPLIDTININLGADNFEYRPVIYLNIVLKGKQFNKVLFSLGNRASNRHKVLLGCEFLQKIKATVKVA